MGVDGVDHGIAGIPVGHVAGEGRCDPAGEMGQDGGPAHGTAAGPGTSWAGPYVVVPLGPPPSGGDRHADPE